MPYSWPHLSLRSLMLSDSGSVGMTEDLNQIIPLAGTIVAGCVGIKSRSLPRGVVGWPLGALEPVGHLPLRFRMLTTNPFQTPVYRKSPSSWGLFLWRS